MLRPASVSEFDSVYTLLRSAFPADERRSYEGQLALLGDPRYTAYVTPELHAVLTLWQFDDFAFIEHFAVDERLRNQGFGTSLLQRMLSALTCPVCLEAELPDTPIARRRLNFYRRNGFFVNEYPYIQPPYSADTHAVPMLLLSTGGHVRAARFDQIRDTLYRHVYHVQP